MSIPKALSKGEEEFVFHCCSYGLPSPEREFVFAKPRKWRFDFAWPERNIAVEIEGGTWNGGRHSRGDGFTKDCQKYNAAALDEWIVFRFTTEMVHSGEAIDTMRRALA